MAYRKYREWRIYLAIRELINWNFIIKTAKKNKNTLTWQSFNLHVDWVGRIYTVLNLRKEDAGDNELVKKTRILEILSPINKYLKSLDLHEIVFPAMEKKSERSYLIVYSPLLKHFTILYAFRILLIITALIFVGIYSPTIIRGITWLINAIF